MRPASRASSRCALESFSEIAIREYGTRSGGSNMPRRTRAANSLLSERSISASVMRPAFTSSSRLRYSVPQVRSVPALTAATAAPPSVGAYPWPRKMSLTAPQSLTTYPSKPHSSRSRFCRRSALAQPGVPFTAL